MDASDAEFNKVESEPDVSMQAASHIEVWALATGLDLDARYGCI